MRRFLTTVLVGLAVSRGAMGQPVSIYNNYETVTSPPTIDAVIFQNSGNFNVSTIVNLSNITSTAIGFGTSPLPFATRDTRYWTNSGTMIGIPGFRFDTATASTRFSALDVVNQGLIVGQDEVAFPVFNSTTAGTTSLPQYSQPVPSQIIINSTNVVNSGELGVGNAGVLSIVTKTFNNEFGSLAAGGVNTGGATTQFVSEGGIETETDPLDTTGRADNDPPYFVNPPGVYDLVWGTTNGTQTTTGLNVAALAGELPSTPPMNSGFRGLFGLTGLNAGGFGGAIGEYASYLWTTNLSPTNVYYEIVLVNTNFLDTNLNASVEFSPNYFNLIPVASAGDPVPPIAIVQFSLTTTDVLTGEPATNAVYLIDIGAQLTNAVLQDNASTPDNYDRPLCFETTTVTPFEWDGGFSLPQAPFDPALVWAPGAYENTTVPYFASTYQVQIGRDPETLDGTFEFLQNVAGTNIQALEEQLLLGTGIILPDPTNEPARVEITAQQADLTSSRIRAEGVVELNITNLTGAGTGASDWGITDASIGATNGNLVLANFFPTNFQRVRGSISAWSATWENVFTNAVTTNENHVHVLVVNQALRGNFRSTIRNLKLNGAKSINVQNDLTIINQATFDTTNLVINANVTLTGGAGNFDATTAPKLRGLFINTNGSLSVDSLLDVGYSLTQTAAAPNRRHYTISQVVNDGTIVATAPLFQTEAFTNNGVILADNNGSIVIDANQITLGSLAVASTSFLEAEGDVTLSAENIQATNSEIIAGGALVLDALQSLSDGVSGAASPTPDLVNHWQVNGGFSLTVKPSQGDLFGTEIVSVAAADTVANHVWAGIDMGASPAGFTNNEVIGTLVLDRLTDSAVMRFSGTGPGRAMYVDNLILTNASFQDYRNGLFIDTNTLRIYFANANADPFKLMEVYPGALIWVTNFTGPNSTVLVTNLYTGSTCLMNEALYNSAEIGFFGVPNLYNQPYVLNEKGNPAVYAPCPGDGSAMSLFISTENVAPGSAYHSLMISANGSGSVGPKLTSVQSAVGSQDTLQATADKGWVFDQWTISGVPSSSATTSPALKFTVGPNSIITANFIPNPFAPLHGVYDGLFYTPGAVASDNAGYFSLTLNPSGTFSGHLWMGAATYNFASQLYGTGIQQFPASSGKKSVTVNIQLDMSGASGQMQGHINGGSWDAPLTANLTPVWSAKNPPPYAGRYTMSLSGGTGIGDSFGAVSVSGTGMASVAGTLADGTAYSAAAPVAANGEWPFYTYAPAGNDTVLGWVNFNAAGIAPTNVTWIKAPSKGRYYPGGFDSAMQLTGSPYNAPARTAPVFSSGVKALFSGGDLSESVNYNMELQKNLGYAAGTVTLSFVNSTGVFSGKFGAGRTMSGVVLQDQDSARGFFLGTNISGAVLLQGN